MKMGYGDCIVFLLAKASQKSQNLLKNRRKPLGLTSVHALVLEALLEEDGLTAGEIGKHLLLDNATVSGVLDRLADSHWIIKRSDTEDKRVLRIFLAAKAKSMEPQLIRERDAANDEVLSGFSMEERIVLKRLLRDFL
ncbi:MAG: MarR family transcriptional regulator [Desulfobacterales bacterium]|nr:MarR family transcriptional regulator [Desulfobacterales bacterium]